MPALLHRPAQQLCPAAGQLLAAGCGPHVRRRPLSVNSRMRLACSARPPGGLCPTDCLKVVPSHKSSWPPGCAGTASLKSQSLHKLGRGELATCSCSCAGAVSSDDQHQDETDRQRSSKTASTSDITEVLSCCAGCGQSIGVCAAIHETEATVCTRKTRRSRKYHGAWERWFRSVPIDYASARSCARPSCMDKGIGNASTCQLGMGS